MKLRRGVGFYAIRPDGIGEITNQDDQQDRAMIPAGGPGERNADKQDSRKSHHGTIASERIRMDRERDKHRGGPDNEQNIGDIAANDISDSDPWGS